MAYVPYSSVLFGRLMAATGFVGTAVFAIYVADSAGYTCSIGVLVSKDLIASNALKSQFLANLSLVVSAVGTASTAIAGVYFFRKGRR